MTVEARVPGSLAPRESSSRTREFFATEDWWAVWIGLAIVVAAALLFESGSSIKWLAVAPKKWSTLPDIIGQLSSHALQYAALFVAWAAVLAVGARAVGLRLARFLPSFALLFVLTIPIFALGVWDQAARYSLEPPVVALVVGLLISNVGLLPAWMDAGFRVEYYIKIGIVLLGATLPLTLILWAGPIAIVQAAIISVITFGVIYFVATRLGLDRRLAATLAAGGAICGVSASIAIAGAVGAKKEHGPIAITLVVLWAIAMVFVLPLASHAFGLSTGVAGAWIGSSEFADATGLAAAQNLWRVRRAKSAHQRQPRRRGRRLYPHEGRRPRHLDRRLGLRLIDCCDDEMGQYRRRGAARPLPRSGGAFRSSSLVSWLHRS